eukprot:31380-Pelagococcus_subviridis.AAC.12
MSALNDDVRGQCSSTLSMRTFSAFTSCGPSSIFPTDWSSSRSRSAAIVTFSLASPTAPARAGS